MKIKINILFIISVAFLFIGCNKKIDNSIELSILNEEIKAYCPDGKCLDAIAIKTDSLINERGRNLLKFKITNNTNKTYVLILACSKLEYGCGTYDSFPIKNYGFSMFNLIFKDKANDSIVKPEFFIYGETAFTNENEKNIAKHYKNLGYFPEASYDAYIMGLFQKGILILPAKETIYFESFFSLPFNKTHNFSSQEFIGLNGKSSYEIGIKLKSELNEAKKQLTNSQKRTIKENGYIIFDGELISKNSIPLIFTTD